MCYMVYVSTDCEDDLSSKSSKRVQFQNPSANTYTPCPDMLKHKCKWFVAGEHACSCEFRHLGTESVELGFGEPQDWFPELADNVEATLQLYEVLSELVRRGYQVEVLDCWSGDEDKEAKHLDVSLAEVPATHFRLFEGYLFSLHP